MSLRAKWQPPGFNVSASSSMETTTVFIPSMPTPVPMPPVYTSTVVVYPSVPPMETSTVVVYPPGPSTTTTTVVAYPPSPSMTTTTVVAYPSAPSVTTETVVVVPESPSVVEVVTTTVVMGPASVATTVYVAIPTHSPVVVEIPVNIESTLTRTVLNAARATQEPAPLSRRQDLFEESACVFCEDKEFCDVRWNPSFAIFVSILLTSLLTGLPVHLPWLRSPALRRSLHWRGNLRSNQQGYQRQQRAQGFQIIKLLPWPVR